MSNTITNWQYEIPTEPGLYLACYGDIETEQNIRFVRLSLYLGHLRTQDGIGPDNYGPSYKWAKLTVGAEARDDE